MTEPKIEKWADIPLGTRIVMLHPGGSFLVGKKAAGHTPDLLAISGLGNKRMSMLLKQGWAFVERDGWEIRAIEPEPLDFSLLTAKAEARRSGTWAIKIDGNISDPGNLAKEIRRVARREDVRGVV